MMKNTFDLSGKVALVTGGNGGIGLGMADAIARAGANVAIWGTNREKNARAAEQLRAHGNEAEAWVCNVADRAEVDTAMAKAVHTPDIRAGYHDAIPLNRYGLEQEIAAAVLFLSGDQAQYITGQTLAVDGGFDAVGIGLPSLRE